MVTNRELIESALKRVNALADTDSELCHNNTGWFVKWYNAEFSESEGSASELLAYLHGLEDALKLMKG